ncbi:hypothetical protein IX51_04510 [uncultured archaeon]|nr:hypothetical protein IX51_04510 [uncultured archaeon]
MSAITKQMTKQERESAVRGANAVRTESTGSDPLELSTLGALTCRMLDRAFFIVFFIEQNMKNPHLIGEHRF